MHAWKDGYSQKKSSPWSYINKNLKPVNFETFSEM